MHGTRFETLIRAVAAVSARASRRTSLRFLAAGILLPALDGVGALDAEAKKRKKGKQKKKKNDEQHCPHECYSSADCCWGAECCKPADINPGVCCTQANPYCHYFRGPGPGEISACFEYPQS